MRYSHKLGGEGELDGGQILVTSATAGEGGPFWSSLGEFLEGCLYLLGIPVWQGMENGVWTVEGEPSKGEMRAEDTNRNCEKPGHLESRHLPSLLSESPNMNKVFVLAKIWGPSTSMAHPFPILVLF